MNTAPVRDGPLLSVVASAPHNDLQDLNIKFPNLSTNTCIHAYLTTELSDFMYFHDRVLLDDKEA